MGTVRLQHLSVPHITKTLLTFQWDSFHICWSPPLVLGVVAGGGKAIADKLANEFHLTLVRLFYNACILAYGCNSSVHPVAAVLLPEHRDLLPLVLPHRQTIGSVWLPSVCLQSASHSDPLSVLHLFKVYSPVRIGSLTTNEPLLLPFPQPHYLLLRFSLDLLGYRSGSGEKCPLRISPQRAIP
jgi:hypothetical protein